MQKGLNTTYIFDTNHFVPGMGLVVKVMDTEITSLIPKEPKFFGIITTSTPNFVYCTCHIPGWSMKGPEGTTFTIDIADVVSDKLELTVVPIVKIINKILDMSRKEEM